MYAPGTSLTGEVRRRIVRISYQRLDGVDSQRRVRPVALAFWGGVWTVAAWCEQRDGFRVFRVDRISALDLLDETFTPRRGQRLADFLRHSVPARDRRALGLPA